MSKLTNKSYYYYYFKLRENELKDVQHDYALVEKEYNVNARRVELLQANLDRLEKDRDALKADLSDLEKKFEEIGRASCRERV